MTAISRSSRIIVYAVLLIYAAIIVVPVMWMLFTALKTEQELVTNPLGLPSVWYFENFAEAWRKSRIPLYFANTSFLIAIVYLAGIGAASLISFALSRFQFRGRNLIYVFFLAGLMVPIHAVIIPVYVLAIQLGALNSLIYLGLVYSAFSLPLSMVILYSFMIGIPHEIEESAVIDGCGAWTIYLRLILPMTREGLISAAILVGLNAWNDLLLPLVLLSNPLKLTISIGMTQFAAQFQTFPTQMMAGCFISMIPILVLYAFLQEKVIAGMTIGAIKG